MHFSLLTYLNDIFLLLLGYWKLAKNCLLYFIKPSRQSPKVLVVLTTYPKRFHNIWPVIESLLDIKALNAEIILVLSESEVSRRSIYWQLRLQSLRGLSIHFVDENLGPHKKYFYHLKYASLRSIPLITVDDDIIYNCDYLLSLYKTFQRFPSNNVVIGNCGAVISCTNKTLNSYPSWLAAYAKTEGHNVILKGFGGIIYSPQFCSYLSNDSELPLLIQKYWGQDDLTQKYFELKYGFKCICLGKSVPSFRFRSGPSLSAKNNLLGTSPNTLSSKSLFTRFTNLICENV